MQERCDKPESGRNAGPVRTTIYPSPVRSWKRSAPPGARWRAQMLYGAVRRGNQPQIFKAGSRQKADSDRWSAGVVSSRAGPSCPWQARPIPPRRVSAFLFGHAGRFAALICASALRQRGHEVAGQSAKFRQCTGHRFSQHKAPLPGSASPVIKRPRRLALTQVGSARGSWGPTSPAQVDPHV